MPSLKRVNFNQILTFDRNTDKTGFVLQSDGFGNQVPTLKTFAPNEPAKVIVDPLTKERLGISIHGQRTNLVQWSEDFGNAYWTKNGTASVSPSSETSPCGNANAFLLSGASGTDAANNALRVNVNVEPSTNYTASLFVKLTTATTAAIVISDNFTGLRTTTLISGEGWQRVWVARSSGASTTQMRYVVQQADGDLLICGAQFEAGAFATPYIKTEGTTVTRLADNCRILDINQQDWFNVNAGTFTVYADARDGDTLLTCGDLVLTADFTGKKKYTISYNSPINATELVFGPMNGTIAEVTYSPLGA